MRPGHHALFLSLRNPTDSKKRRNPPKDSGAHQRDCVYPLRVTHYELNLLFHLAAEEAGSHFREFELHILRKLAVLAL